MFLAREAGPRERITLNCASTSVGIFLRANRRFEGALLGHEAQRAPAAFHSFWQTTLGAICFAFAANFGLKIAVDSSSILCTEKLASFASFLYSMKQLCRPGNLWSLCLERALGLGFPAPWCNLISHLTPFLSPIPLPGGWADHFLSQIWKHHSPTLWSCFAFQSPLPLTCVVVEAEMLFS